MPGTSNHGIEAITPDQIRAHVRTYWELFSGKQRGGFAAFYAPTATVFAADARRSEPARLMLVRRERELFSPVSSVQARLGEITVQVLSPNVATACYPLHFAVTRELPNGARVRSEVPFARTTQVFHRNEKGELIIIHEHMSSAEPVSPQTLPIKPSS
jgi:ketosteroid isomerase-like protein